MKSIPNILIYDLETANPILKKGELPVAGVSYCLGGWEDHKGMGISVACAWIGWKHAPMVFLEENLRDLGDYAKASDLLVGFNNVGFDDPVLRAHEVEIPEGRSYDMMKKYVEATGRRAKLEDICQENFGVGKSMSGAMAPILWQQGKKLEVINYCLGDVGLTRRLFELIWRTGEILHPYERGRRIKIQKPFETAEDFQKR